MANFSSVSTTLALAAASLVAGVGCGDSNQAGDLAAEAFGDLSHPLTFRRAALADISETCGLTAYAPAPGTVLQRRPYLQQLTAGSVELAWTTDSNAAAPLVVVTRPDGTPVMTVNAVRDLDARPAGGAAQWQAAVAGLEPDTAYCYQVMGGGTQMRRAGFRTAPASDSGRPVRFVAIGDSGKGGADQLAVLEQMRQLPFDLMLHVGDIAYDSGTRDEFETTFFSIYADLMEGFAIFPASGNHDYRTEGAAPFRESFVLPKNGGAAGAERWYSYDFGNVHFVALDTEQVGPEQVAWLDADLTANRLPWTIAYLHRPPFSSGDHGSEGSVQQHFVPLFAKHRVPLVLAGHDHDYERTIPIDGVTYVVTGGGGRGTRPVGKSWFTAFAESVCHLVYVTVEVDQLTLHAIDAMGTEFDSLAIGR